MSSSFGLEERSRAASYHQFSLEHSFRKMMSDAFSPVRQLRLSVVVSPAAENDRSEATHDAWTARYFRANTASLGKMSHLLAHHLSTPPALLTDLSDTSILKYTSHSLMTARPCTSSRALFLDDLSTPLKAFLLLASARAKIAWSGDC